MTPDEDPAVPTATPSDKVERPSAVEVTAMAAIEKSRKASVGNIVHCLFVQCFVSMPHSLWLWPIRLIYGGGKSKKAELRERVHPFGSSAIFDRTLEDPPLSVPDSRLVWLYRKDYHHVFIFL